MLKFGTPGSVTVTDAMLVPQVQDARPVSVRDGRGFVRHRLYKLVSFDELNRPLFSGERPYPNPYPGAV